MICITIFRILQPRFELGLTGPKPAVLPFTPSEKESPVLYSEAQSRMNVRAIIVHYY